MDGWTDGWIDGWIDGLADVIYLIYIITILINKLALIFSFQINNLFHLQS
jgi:hypothetical protein